LRDEITIAGFGNVTDLESEGKIGVSDAEFADYPIDSNVIAVVIGITLEWSFRTVAIANFYLCNPNILFVATNDDPVWLSGASGRLMPDIGALLASHEIACGRKAFRIGKP
jgi:ribonucleotide monophosphatase NagD (HAD superfamily)